MYDIRQNLLSSWLPPGGSCHDEISASRNRYFVVTDEGWRWLKVLDFPVEWRKPEHMPLIQLHSKTNLSPPLISQPCRFRSAVKSGSFPPGEAKNSEDFGDNHSTNRSIAWASGRQVGDPYRVWGKPLACSNQHGTLPQLRIRSAAPSEREPRALRAADSKKAATRRLFYIIRNGK